MNPCCSELLNPGAEVLVVVEVYLEVDRTVRVRTVIVKEYREGVAVGA